MPPATLSRLQTHPSPSQSTSSPSFPPSFSCCPVGLSEVDPALLHGTVGEHALLLAPHVPFPKLLGHTHSRSLQGREGKARGQAMPAGRNSPARWHLNRLCVPPGEAPADSDHCGDKRVGTWGVRPVPQPRGGERPAGQLLGDLRPVRSVRGGGKGAQHPGQRRAPLPPPCHPIAPLRLPCPLSRVSCPARRT